MSKLPLVLFGAGGHARACIDVIEEQDRYKVVGLIGLQEEVGKTVDGYEVIASEQNLSEISRYAPYALVAVGQIKSAHKRINLYKNAIESGFELAIVISPHAYVSSRAQVGFGTIVMHGAVINSNAKVGTNCIVNSQSLIEHDVSILDNCHIATGVIINGGVQVGNGCFIGSGSILRENVTVGDYSFVPMGSEIPANVEASDIYQRQDVL